ncbi:MAG: DUF1493 family protein [Flavobacteriaceae bacterium]|nr:DUF1493 family protein [Flavobacteriaceae bacterium]
MIDVKKELINFFSNRIGPQFKDNPIINLNKYNFYDLDAECLMNEFFLKFKIKHDNFNTSDFFVYPKNNWKDLIFIRSFFPNRYSQKPFITLNHLIQVIERGEWFNPDNKIDHK